LHTDRRDKSAAHFLFEVGIWLKGIDAVLEMMGGILLAFFTTAQISRFLVFATRHELSREPNDAVANYIFNLSQRLSVDAQNFASGYLILHGAVKLLLVVLILKRKLWAYPFGIAFFAVFGAYEVYRFSYTGPLWLILFACADFLLAFLTFYEYRKLKPVRKKEEQS
jgi:uncharacterized membrane protein